MSSNGLLNAVGVVENHVAIKTNTDGEKTLPQLWMKPSKDVGKVINFDT